MKQKFIKPIHLFFALVLLTVAFSCQKSMNGNSANARPGGDNEFSPKELKSFVQVNLVGDNNDYQPQHIDPNLVNPWSITFPPTGPALVSSESNGLSAVYTLDGLVADNAVGIPGGGSSGNGHPTGNTYNFTSDFKLSNGNPAKFIFASSDGTISGWNGGNKAERIIDHSSSACYLGVALAPDGTDFFLYVANFAQNRIDVYDKNWNPVNKPFLDPDLPAGYSPFNIQFLSDGKIYVMYAKKDAAGKKETGQGYGFINVFSPDGTLQKRFASKGKLNAPWGIAKAPAAFWGQDSRIANVILVANSGDGSISAFDENGNYLGPLSKQGKPIEIDGLLGITFPPLNGLRYNCLYFAAGPNAGKNGLVGYIKTSSIN